MGGAWRHGAHLRMQHAVVVGVLLALPHLARPLVLRLAAHRREGLGRQHEQVALLRRVAHAAHAHARARRGAAAAVGAVGGGRRLLGVGGAQQPQRRRVGAVGAQHVCVERHHLVAAEAVREADAVGRDGQRGAPLGRLELGEQLALEHHRLEVLAVLWQQPHRPVVRMRSGGKGKAWVAARRRRL